MEISKTKTALLTSLQSKKMRLRHGLFIAEGEKCVADMLDGFGLECIVATQTWLRKNNGAGGASADKILEAPEQVMRKISSLSTAPDVLAVFRIPRYATEPQEEDLTLNPAGLYLLIDGIQDPGNLGTIIRTADWFGFHTIYASRDTVDVFNPKTIQATMGSLRRVKVVYTDLATLISRNKVGNVYGTLLEGNDIFRTSLEPNGVIIMGNEGNGISEPIRKLVTKALLIPDNCPTGSRPDSLNVAIATGIVLAEFRNNCRKS